jgi:hypothetical protein
MAKTSSKATSRHIEVQPNSANFSVESASRSCKAMFPQLAHSGAKMQQRLPHSTIPRFCFARELDARGPFQRERRRQLEASGLYPPRIRISPRLNAWLLAEILAWENLLTAGVRGEAMREAIRQMVNARPTNDTARDVHQ